MLSVLGNLSVDALVDKNGSTSDIPVDLLHTNMGIEKIKNGFTASDLNKTIQKYLDKVPVDTRPTWLVRFLICSISFRVMIGLSQFIDISVKFCKSEKFHLS
jgi:hypothetical protein